MKRILLSLFAVAIAGIATAQNVGTTVTREAEPGDYGTVVFDYDATVEGATLYNVVDFSATAGLSVTPAGTELTAGTPYIYKADAASVVFTRTSEETVKHGAFDCTEANVGNGLVGAYSGVPTSGFPLTWIQGNYLIDKNIIRLVGSTPVPANQCFFDQNKVKKASVSTDVTVIPFTLETGDDNTETVEPNSGYYYTAYLTSGGKNRKMEVYIPKRLPENSPVVIALHGIGGWGDNLYQGTQYHLVADTAKFAVVYPDAIDGTWDIWNNTDVEFFKKIIDYMATNHKINKGRAYLSGFSFGGMMTYHMIHKSASTFAAYAPIAGVPFYPRDPSGNKHVPIIHHHGNKDTTVKFGGDWSHPAGGYPSITEYVTGWAEWDGCDMDNPEVKKVGNDTHTIWKNEAENIEVQYNILHGVGHTISDNPNATHTTRELWRFCKRYSTNGDFSTGDVMPDITHVGDEVTRNEAKGTFSTAAFDYDATISGAVLYEVVSFDANEGLTITETDENMTAGTPYLYFTTADRVVFTRQSDKTVAHGDYDCTLADVGNGLVGCYSGVGPSNNWFAYIYGNYCIDSDRIRLIGDNPQAIPSNKCFFDQNKCKPKTVSTPTEILPTPAALTGITTPKAALTPGKVYDLNGREVKTLRPGQTYITNGMKINVK